MEERSWTVANWVGERRRANWTGRTKAFVLVGSSGLERESVCVWWTYEVTVKDVVNQLEEESVYEKQSTTSYFGSKNEE